MNLDWAVNLIFIGIVARILYELIGKAGRESIAKMWQNFQKKQKNRNIYKPKKTEVVDVELIKK